LFLFSICSEIQRIGGHIVEPLVLQYLVYALSERSMAVFRKFRADRLPLNKDGLVQLLFDIRLLFEVLSWRREVDNVKELHELRETIAAIKGLPLQQGPNATSETSELMQWNAKVNTLIADFEQDLDPIDVAFYQKHLKDAVQRCYKRYAVLLGPLMQLSKLHMNSTTTITTTTMASE
jgi:hypothetical protein